MRGKEHSRGVVWFGARSFWERDWMTPENPNALVARITGVLRRETHDAVSRAVARLVFAPYELPDPDRLGAFLPAQRGEILLQHMEI